MIFHISIPCNKTFPWVPLFFTLWPCSLTHFLKTLILLITFEQYVLEDSYCTWASCVTRSSYWYPHIFPCDLGHLWNWSSSGAYVFHKNILFLKVMQKCWTIKLSDYQYIPIYINQSRVLPGSISSHSYNMFSLYTRTHFSHFTKAWLRYVLIFNDPVLFLNNLSGPKSGETLT